ncbi:hypothetical protein F5B17DRAFT_394028 [Nemania serpens]|nr:hypothetical protein F5B17DRAFT_394028 [Nemania serpens]
MRRQTGHGRVSLMICIQPARSRWISPWLALASSVAPLVGWLLPTLQCLHDVGRGGAVSDRIPTISNHSGKELCSCSIAAGLHHLY